MSAWVAAAVLAKVENLSDAKSIAYACAELSSLAASRALNARDVAGSLLRTCVVPKLGYLCRTVRPDLLLLELAASPLAARSADNIVAHTFCAVFHSIFGTSATAEQRLAAARVRLPTSLAGVGLRSMVTISRAAYFASLRAVAPAISVASSPAASAALASLSPATEQDATAAPLLRAVAVVSRQVATVMEDDTKQLVDLATFCDQPLPGIQRVLTHAVEKDVHASAIAAARPDEIMRAFLHSCDGRWVRTSRLRWLQLANEETTLRMQRYLRQPLSALAGIVGTRGVDTKRTVLDPFGDALLTGYKAKNDAEHINTHNALSRLLSTCASQAHVRNVLEGGKVRGTKKKPGDVRLCGDAGSHGWAPALNREVWADVTVVCPVLPSYVHAASAERGATAAKAARGKRGKYRDDIPGFVFFLPLAFETEGYHTTDLTKLLYGFAMKRATADGWDGAAAKKRASCWCDFWLNQFAMKHARFTSRCVLHRASVCKDAANPSFRRASVVDVSLGSSMLLPRKPPPPPPPPLPGTASAAAAAPAR